MGGDKHMLNFAENVCGMAEAVSSIGRHEPFCVRSGAVEKLQHV